MLNKQGGIASQRSPVRTAVAQVQTRPPGSVLPTRPEIGGTPWLLDRNLILNLQRLSGNAAVSELLAPRARAPGPPTVQRCGDHACVGACPHTIEEQPAAATDRQWLQRAVAAPVVLTSPQFAGDARLEKASENAPPIKRGDSGDPVAKVQQALMDDGFAMGGSIKSTGPDKSFGGETERVVKAFQHKHDLDVDGQVGHDTISKLDELNLARAGGAVAPVKPPPVTGFEVRGKRRQDAKFNDPGKVFFEENKSDIDSFEADKITKLAKPEDRQLTLNGFVSEEEAGGAALDDARLKAVADQLKAAGHLEPKITVVPKPDAGGGRIDYRNLRSVEIVVAGAKSAVPDCTAGPDISLGPPPNQFSTGHERALTMLDGAIAKLVTPLDPDTKALLTRLFGGPAQMTAVRTNLIKIRDHVKHMTDPGRSRAHNACDGSCSGAIAYNNDVGSAAVMTVCPAYLGTADAGERAGTLIHEGSHGTGGLQTDDVAYAFERVINLLTPKDALNNADSYLLFTRNLETANSERIGPEEKDEFSGMANPAEEQAVERIVAFLERWLDSASSEVSSLYDTITDSRKKGHWTNGYYQASMGFVAHRFGFTKPPALPTKDEQQKIAGINDRFELLFRRLGRKMKVEKAATGLDRWEPGPGTTITVTPTFFKLTKREQLDLLLTRMIQAFPEIIPAHQPIYVALTDDFRKHFGTPAP